MLSFGTLGNALTASMQADARTPCILRQLFGNTSGDPLSAFPRVVNLHLSSSFRPKNNFFWLAIKSIYHHWLLGRLGRRSSRHTSSPLPPAFRPPPLLASGLLLSSSPPRPSPPSTLYSPALRCRTCRPTITSAAEVHTTGSRHGKSCRRMVSSAWRLARTLEHDMKIAETRS